MWYSIFYYSYLPVWVYLFETCMNPGLSFSLTENSGYSLEPWLLTPVLGDPDAITSKGQWGSTGPCAVLWSNILECWRASFAACSAFEPCSTAPSSADHLCVRCSPQHWLGLGRLDIGRALRGSAISWAVRGRTGARTVRRTPQRKAAAQCCCEPFF